MYTNALWGKQVNYIICKFVGLLEAKRMFKEPPLLITHSIYHDGSTHAICNGYSYSYYLLPYTKFSLSAMSCRIDMP